MQTTAVDRQTPTESSPGRFAAVLDEFVQAVDEAGAARVQRDWPELHAAYQQARTALGYAADDKGDARLVARVVLQRFERGELRTVAVRALDVTEAVLSLSPREIERLMLEFDEGCAPFLEDVPGAQAERLAQQHRGPSEAALPLRRYFEQFGLVGGEVTQAMIDAARRAAGVPLAGMQPAGDATVPIAAL